MSIKSKNDINYLQFLKFHKEIEGQEDNLEFVADKIIEHFYPNVTDGKAAYVELFANALHSQEKAKFRYNIDLSFKTAKEWINADTRATDGDIPELLSHILKPYYFWQKFDINKLSVADAEHALQLFIKGQVKLGSSTNIFTTRPYKRILGI
jgi:predicted SnoaL-like aldol condensation-catalyzing enzyme